MQTAAGIDQQENDFDWTLLLHADNSVNRRTETNMTRPTTKGGVAQVPLMVFKASSICLYSLLVKLVFLSKENRSKEQFTIEL